MEKNLNDLFDLGELRARLMEHMVFAEKSADETAKEIGISLNTLMAFLLEKKKPIFKTIAKMVKFINAHTTETVSVIGERKSAQA